MHFQIVLQPWKKVEVQECRQERTTKAWSQHQIIDRERRSELQVFTHRVQTGHKAG